MLRNLLILLLLTSTLFAKLSDRRGIPYEHEGTIIEIDTEYFLTIKLSDGSRWTCLDPRQFRAQRWSVGDRVAIYQSDYRYNYNYIADNFTRNNFLPFEWVMPIGEPRDYSEVLE